MIATREAPVRAWWWAWSALAAVVHVPLLLTRPGWISADSKSALYIDPGRFLGRAVSMWDPSTALGTVPHQQIGFLWPAGPWYWLFDTAGVPDWVAQRLWLATILSAAGGGVLFLARSWRWRLAPAIAAAFVYALSPFVLTLAARLSVLLLPFAGLPWMLALVVRGLHRRGWRHAALFALVVATAGSVNATAILLAGLAPALWVVYAVFVAGEVSRARALNTVSKFAAVTIPVNLWWIMGLSVQATNGIDVLRYTETAEVVARSSTAPELLRGLGYWFFYGGDRLGPWIEPASDYTQRLWLIGTTYTIAVVGLLALGVVRWRHRKFLIGLSLLGLVVAVGAHPWGSPSPVGRAVKALLLTDVGLAMRSLPRAVPLVALASAMGIGSLVAAMAEQKTRRGVAAALAVCALAVVSLPPLWMRTMVPDNLSRPEDLPTYWRDAAAALDADGSATRVLELPGADFASYRWGNTVDPVLPAMIDRPTAARELVPAGSPASAQLLGAIDERFQEGTMPPTGLAPLARLLGVGTVLARNDLQYERYNTPRPRSLYALLGATEGLRPGPTFGDGVVNRAGPVAPMVDEVHLSRDAALPPSPALALFGVESPEPVVRTRPAGREVLLSGDADGIVDAAIAGLLRGDEIIRYSAESSDDPDFALAALTEDRALVVTDSNRRRGQRWTTVRHTRGFTEPEDGGILREDHTDNRLQPVPRRTGTATVAEHGPVLVRATGYGNPITFTPEERPVLAADGDPSTAWRVAAFQDSVGHRIELTAARPVTASGVRLLQPQSGEINRWITRVTLRFDGRDAVDARLDDTSRSGAGQEVSFPARTFRTLSITIRADSAGRRPGYGALTSVGFAEIGVAGLRADEVIRMPDDLLSAGGFRTTRYPLAIVQTRLRSLPTEVTRTDEEFAMERALRLPSERSYALRGTARLSARAPTAILDSIIGRRAPGVPAVTASTWLPGGLAHLPSNVLDGDTSTRWTGAFGPTRAATLAVETDVRTSLDGFAVTVVDDEAHSRPTAVRLVADGDTVGTWPLEPARGAALVPTRVELAGPVTATSFELVFDAVEAETTTNWYGGGQIQLPMAVAEVDLGGLRVPAPAPLVDSGCRPDLVRIDGRDVPVRITGSGPDAVDGGTLEVTGCEPTTLAAGDHRFSTTEGRTSGWDIDQVVWRSAAGGGPATSWTPFFEPQAGPTVEITADHPAETALELTGAEPGREFWLVSGQSHNPGWALTVEGGTADGPHLVDGYTSGWKIVPETTSLRATLRFTPQNRVDIAFVVSVLATLGALWLATGRPREIRPLPIALQEPLRRLRAFRYEGALPTRRQARLLGAGAGVAATLLVNPVIGLGVGVLAGLTARRETWRPWLTVLPAGLLATVGLYVVIVQYRNDIGPGLHWPDDTGRLHSLGLAAVILLAVDVAISELWWRHSEYR